MNEPGKIGTVHVLTTSGRGAALKACIDSRFSTEIYFSTTALPFSILDARRYLVSTGRLTGPFEWASVRYEATPVVLPQAQEWLFDHISADVEAGRICLVIIYDPKDVME